MTAPDESAESYIDSVEGEIAFFRSVMRARPVGIHRHFHALAIRNAIQRDTGRWVPMEDIWRKLRECYDLDVLESLEIDGFEVPGEKKGPPVVLPLRSPSPSENLNVHPYFRAEYNLPEDPSIEDMISRRRMRASASVASTSPAPSLVPEKPAPSTRGSKRKKVQLKNMAGLVAGDSDSSALTQESGDESLAPTPTTNPDAGTEYAEGEGEHEQSPESTAPSKRKGTKGRRNSGAATRGKPSTSTRGVKKRKR